MGPSMLKLVLSTSSGTAASWWLSSSGGDTAGSWPAWTLWMREDPSDVHDGRDGGAALGAGQRAARTTSRQIAPELEPVGLVLGQDGG